MSSRFTVLITMKLSLRLHFCNFWLKNVFSFKLCEVQNFNRNFLFLQTFQVTSLFQRRTVDPVLCMNLLAWRLIKTRLSSLLATTSRQSTLLSRFASENCSCCCQDSARPIRLWLKNSSSVALSAIFRLRSSSWTCSALQPARPPLLPPRLLRPFFRSQLSHDLWCPLYHSCLYLCIET